MRLLRQAAFSAPDASVADVRYEKALGEIAADDVRTAQLIAECSDLRTGLELSTLSKGESLLYEELTELIIRISDYMLRAHEALRQNVRKTMGGEVLELINDRAERLEREAEARGIEMGIEQGIEQGIDSLANQLKKQGVDESLIDKAIDALRSENESKQEAAAE